MLKNLKQFNAPEIEEKVLKRWRENNILEQVLAGKTVHKEKKKTFTFYEGPPTANGKPGIHHVLARSFKDIILRYKTMQGYFVPRKAGWDTHGLPVEIQVEKELGLKNKKDIEEYGVEAFNKKCRESVWQYKDEWERLTERIGFWLDLKNPYITYETSYMESVWWILAQAWEKKLLYKGHKILPWCPRCETALSSHELAQGYKEVTDTSVYVKFKLLANQKIGNFTTDDKTYILSWTTTPWTLPGNVALAIRKDIRYTGVRLVVGKELLIVAEDLVETVFKELAIETVDTYKGSDLTGISYEPLFDVKPLRSEKSYHIYPADFVTTTDGTGVVHTAVMYGEDDYKLGTEIGLPQHHTVDEGGKFTSDVSELVGKKVRSQEAQNAIFSYLERRGLLFKKENYTHDYPFCWRCSSALIYYARDSWFIAMSTLREKLLKENATIDWVPAHIKDGRFGEWLREVKDWAISRERYWGTPLPLWECNACEHTEAIASLDELSSRGKKQKNTYVLLRHGEAEHNVDHTIDSGQREIHLTERGKKEIQKAIRALKRKKIDRIISSDVLRTRETAEMVQKGLGVQKVIFDPRLKEIQLGVLAGCHDKRYHEQFPTYRDKFKHAPQEGETLKDLRARLWKAIQEYEKKYTGENILLVSHEYPIWMLTHTANGWDEGQSVREKEARGEDFVNTGTIHEMVIKDLPRDDTGEADIHKPYIDAVTFPCSHCKGTMKRISGIADVWFDSGAMPFAQVHYPFGDDSKKRSKPKTLNAQQARFLYPADYISEGVDQTRGWFYTLLAIGTLLGKKAPYKHAISLGHILDKNSQKMSKSKGNIVDPWEEIAKHGSDAIRWYFYTANDPGEPKRFDEGELVKVSRKLYLLMYNSFVFLQTYGLKTKNYKPETKNKQMHVLDRWILSRYHGVVAHVTDKLDNYDIGSSARLIEALVDDVSRWYIRRSRSRFGEQSVDRSDASHTLKTVLLGISKLLAPFCPFLSDAFYISLDGRATSVHLDAWTMSNKKMIDRSLESQMSVVRHIASDALALRTKHGIKVKQPLQKLIIHNTQLTTKYRSELIEILKEEINVKEIVFSAKGGFASGEDMQKEDEGELELDTHISPELYREGIVREVIRTVQKLRQDAGLTPHDLIEMVFVGNAEIASMLIEAGDVFTNIIRAQRFECLGQVPDKKVFSGELTTKIDRKEVYFGIKKI